MSENIMSRPDYRANMRTAMAAAKLSMRIWERELGGYKADDLIRNIDMCRWLVERIRLEGPTMSELELIGMNQQLLMKLSVIELGAIKLLGMPCVTGPDGSLSRPAQRSAQVSILDLKGLRRRVG